MPESSHLRGVRVFIVEDEALVAINLETMLEDLGCVVAGLEMRLPKALASFEGDVAADVVVLDVNLGGHKVFPLAERLAERRIPFVFATGYGREGLPAEWQDRPVIQKPYLLTQLAAALVTAMAGRIS